MAMIHVARDGAKLGEFTLEQIREGLGTGQFKATDLAWQSGMADWRPLSEVAGTGTTDPGTAAPALPLAAAGFSTATPAGGLPWEHREQLGLVKAWFDTVSLLITKPSDAFTMMRPEGGFGDPLVFGLIGGCAGGIVSLLFQGLFNSIPAFAGGNDLFNSFGVGIWTIIVIYAVMMPLFVTAGLFIWGAVLHLCLMMVGGANRSFETTFRVACFASGSANLFSMIPICGGIIALVYHIVLDCIGLSRAHPTTTGKALLAIFLPLIVCCGLMVLVIVLAGGLGALLSNQR